MCMYILIWIPYECILHLLYSSSTAEAAVLTGTVPFCSSLLVCALLNPLLLSKLSACNELNSFWLSLIRIFMRQTGRIPQKHISVSFELKHLCRGILLNGGKWKCFRASCCRWPSSPPSFVPLTIVRVQDARQWIRGLKPTELFHLRFIHSLPRYFFISTIELKYFLMSY